MNYGDIITDGTAKFRVKKQTGGYSLAKSRTLRETHRPLVGSCVMVVQ